MPDILLAAASSGGYFAPVLRRIKDRRLVIVEDNDAIKDSLAEYFGELNTVRAFSSGEETLAAQADLADAQVFIIDYKLPGLDGSELFRQLRPRFPQARYILITGEMNYEVAETNRAMGWDALILKPFDFGILEDNISVLVSPDPAASASPAT